MLEVHDRIKANDTDAGTTLTGYASKVHRIVDTMSEENRFRCEVTLGEMPTVVTHPLLALVKFVPEHEYGEMLQMIASQGEQLDRAITLFATQSGDVNAWVREGYLQLNETVSAGDSLYICSDGETAGLINATMDEAKKGYDIVLALEDGDNGGVIRVLYEGPTSYGPAGTKGEGVYLDRTDGDMTTDPNNDLVSGDALRKLGTVMNDGRMYWKPSTLSFEKA